MALVVQPGVEFDHMRVVDYRAGTAGELGAVLDDEPAMTFEAHSTDYQTLTGLRALVTDGWRVLKVGPGLTFAMREALFALAGIESELIGPDQRSRLREVVERRMLAAPEHWERYCPGSATEQYIGRLYSYSDRIRYYWPDAEIDAAVQRLLQNLDDCQIPEPMLSAFLPDQYHRVRAGLLSNDPKGLVLDRIRGVLQVYTHACMTQSTTRV
jgi:D-tagatose-1,6-bisphosphate aldolase subunit GatZ/KbaZ